MTREQHIADIRQKCIEANPGREWVKEVVDVDGDQEPTRLADVLLAIGAAGIEMMADASFQEPGSINIFPSPDSPRRMMQEPTWCRWNGYLDDLTEQSDECIEFLHALLCGV